VPREALDACHDLPEQGAVSSEFRRTAYLDDEGRPSHAGAQHRLSSVVANRRLIGIVTTTDVMAALAEQSS